MNDWRSYNSVAETYERVHSPRLADVARDLVRMAEPKPGDRVLDVGTGTGVAAEAAAEAGARVTGIDGSMGMMRVGERARPALRFVGARAIDLPFRNATFDAATGNFVLAHFTKVETALFDILRVLRPGGRVAVSAWADGVDAYQDAWVGLVESVIPREVLAPAYAQVAPWHERFSRRAAVEEALAGAGLRRVRSEVVKYRWTYSLADFVDGLEVWAIGRFVHEMLGERGWPTFKERVRTTFAERFPDPLNDFREVVLAVGVKE